MMKANIGTHNLTKNAGVIAKPEDYEMTWVATMKDKSKICMFGEKENYNSRIPFDQVKLQYKNLDHVLWIHTKDKSLHFGVICLKQIYFMINGFIYSPISSLFYSGKNFVPEVFIRNSITLQSENTIFIKEKEMAYFVGFSFLINGLDYKMHIAWDGISIKKYGFINCEKIGEYSLDG